MSKQEDDIAEGEQFRLLVASIRDYAIFMLDTTGHIASWNSGAQQIKGYVPDEIIGRHISTFYTPEDAAAGRPEKLLEIARTEGRVEDEGWRVRKDGTHFWADVVITALRDADGRLRGFAKVTRDLTKQHEAEQRLKYSEESLAATLYSIGDAVLAADEQARVTRINPVAERLTGWTESEAIGKPLDVVFDIINEDTRAKAANPVSRVLAEGIVVGLANHTALIARDGTERPIADSGAPIRDAQGRIRGAVLVFRDVTLERRGEEALRQSEERLQLMIGSISDYAVYMLNPEGRVTTWNPGAERIKGYRAAEIIGEHFSRFFAPEDVDAGKPAQELEIATRESRYEEESWRVRKDGGRFWANVILTPMRDETNRVVGFVKVTRDLTERRHLEAERLRLGQAQEAIRLRDEFLAIASHELKTPLTALQLQLESIRRIAGTPEAIAQRIDRAIRVGERLARLIDTLLDVSRIARGSLKLNPEPFDFVEAARDVVERLRETAATAGCDVRLAAEAAVPGCWDRLRIEQVLMNLVSNAIKYARGKPVDVRVARHGNDVVLQVEDGGPGIPVEDLPRIFERFERAASTHHYGGLGLGLYVARQIAEAHGGTATAENVPGGGASFTVRLPLECAAPST